MWVIFDHSHNADERMSGSACLAAGLKTAGLKMAGPLADKSVVQGRDPGTARLFSCRRLLGISLEAASPPGWERRRYPGLRSAGAGRMGMRASYFVVDRWLGAGRWLSLTGIAGE
jgi:hypothetical protein